MDGWRQVGQQACEVVTVTSSVLPRSVRPIVSMWRGVWGGKRFVPRSVHVIGALPAGAGCTVRLEGLFRGIS